MEGIAERERRSVQNMVAAAWWNEYFARQDKLNGLKAYLDQLKPRKPQTADDVLAVFREHEARAPGAFRIKHFGPDGRELN